MNSASNSIRENKDSLISDHQYICMYDYDLKMVDCCANYTTLKGISSSDLIGKSIGEVYPSNTRIDQFKKVLATGIPSTATIQMKSAAKEIFDVEEQILRLNKGLVVIGKNVSPCNQERKEKEAKEYALSLIAKHSSQFFLLVDLEGKILFIDKTYDAKIEDVIGTYIYDYHDGQNEQLVKDCIATVLRTKTASTYEVKAFVRDKGELTFEGTIMPIIENGRIVKLSITTNGITERKKIENKLKTINKQYLNLLELTNSRTSTQDKELRYTSILNPIKPYTEEFIIGKTDRELVSSFDENAQTVESIKLEVLETGRTIRRDITISLDDNLLHFDFLAQPIIKEEEIIGITCTAFDITERIKRKEALEESEIRLKEAEEIAHTGYYDIDLASGNMKWSEETYRIVGVNPNEYTPHIESYLNFIHEEDREMVNNSLESMIGTGEILNLTFRLQGNEEGIKHIKKLSRVQYNEEGKVTRIFGTIQDITSQIKLDFKLKEQKAFIQKIVDSSPSLIFILDLEKRENVFLNNASDRLLGYSKEEVRENHNLFMKQLSNITIADLEKRNLNEKVTTFLSFIHPADRQLFVDFVRMFVKDKSSRVFDLNFRHQHKEGYWIWLQHRLVAFNRNEEGNVSQLLGIVSDISNLKEAEKKSKMAMIEGQEKERRRIAKDLHDAINPLLSAAKLNVESLEYHENDCNKEQQVNLSNVVSLLSQSMREIKDISFDLMPAILKDFGLVFTLRDYCKKITEGGKLKVYLDIHGVETRLSEDREVMLFRIAQELINNVIKHANATQIELQLIAHQKTLILMVEDDGNGMDIIKNSRSTNSYGLKNVESRVKALNGTMATDSVLNRGTIITIEIPRK